MARAGVLVVLLLGAALADEPWHNDNSKAASKYADMVDEGAEQYRENRLKEVTEKVMHALDSAPIRYLAEHPEQVRELEVLAAVVVGGVIAHEVMVHKEQVADALEHVTRALRGAEVPNLFVAPAPPPAVAAPEPEAEFQEVTREVEVQVGEAEAAADQESDVHAEHADHSILRPVNFIKLCLACAALYVFAALREHAHHRAERHLRATAETSSPRVVNLKKDVPQKVGTSMPKSLAEELMSVREAKNVSSPAVTAHYAFAQRRSASTGSTEV